MYISVNKLREFVEVSSDIAQLDETLTMLGIEVEEAIDLSKKYENFFVGKVLTKEKHPNADKLSLCKVSLGARGERDVVCGAPNVEAGQTIAFAELGAAIPGAGFTIERRKIRGYASEGMICSQKELELGEDSSGIWVLPDDAPVGSRLADYLGLNDVTLGLGLTPNKADCLSHIGIARELAAAAKTEVNLPKFELMESAGEKTADAIKITILDKEKCPRYSARIVRDCKTMESPVWLKNFLTKVGFRPINLAADVTNFVLIELGQPLHAFDLGRIEGGEIIVRTAGEGEAFRTLDGKDRTLDSSALMICDARKPIAIGGVMGGENTEVSDSTSDILIESAYFQPASIRRTSKKLGIVSEAAYRFERGVDIDAVRLALDRATELIARLGGGRVPAGAVDVYPEPAPELKIELRYERCRKIIGSMLTDEQIRGYLQALGFELVSETPAAGTFKAPRRRGDVFGEIDLIEEVARLHNYDNIEPRFTSAVDFASEPLPASLLRPDIISETRKALAGYGFNELLTYNLTDPASAALTGETPVELANPLGEELSRMRTSLAPSVLKAVSFNLRNGNRDLRLFEIGKTFRYAVAAEGLLPGFSERMELALVLAGEISPKQWSDKGRAVDFYDIKGEVERMLNYFGLAGYEFAPLPSSTFFSPDALEARLNGARIAELGVVSKDALKRFDIEFPVMLAVFDFSSILVRPQTQKKYSAVSPYPTIERDLSFLFEKKFNAGDALVIARSRGGELLKDAVIFDLYEGKSLGEGKKSLALTLYFSSTEKTLTDEEVEPLIQAIVAGVESDLGGKLRTA